MPCQFWFCEGFESSRGKKRRIVAGRKRNIGDRKLRMPSRLGCGASKRRTARSGRRKRRGRRRKLRKTG